MQIYVLNQASDLPSYDIFASQKVPLSKISDDVISCDLWFGPTTIKNSGYAYALIQLIETFILKKDVI